MANIKWKFQTLYEEDDKKKRPSNVEKKQKKRKDRGRCFHKIFKPKVTQMKSVRAPYTCVLHTLMSCVVYEKLKYSIQSEKPLLNSQMLKWDRNTNIPKIHQAVAYWERKKNYGMNNKTIFRTENVTTKKYKKVKTTEWKSVRSKSLKGEEQKKKLWKWIVLHQHIINFAEWF